MCDPLLLLEQGDISQGIAVNDDHVGQFASVQGADLIAQAKEPRGG